MKTARYCTSVAALVLGSLACAASATAPPTRIVPSRSPSVPPGSGSQDAATLMLEQPAIHSDQVAFVYAGDLWTCHRDGTNLLRLTTHGGNEARPRFSRDGKTIAFSSQYDGNTDVYVVPTTGGFPRRLTWHPSADLVQDFTPDGSAVLFTSRRAVHTNRLSQLFTVPLDGGHPTQLPIPNAAKASYSPDGRHIAYTPLRDVFGQWKNYRGGTATRIWIYDVGDHSIEQIPQPEGRCNDTDPCWIGNQVVFLSDREGEFNVLSTRPGSDRIRMHTMGQDFPALNLSSDGTQAIYEHMGRLVVLRLEETVEQLPITVPADLIETRSRYASGDSHVRTAALSPSGKRAVFGYRGEIVTVPAEHGNPRNLTRTTDVHERSPAWSPDGKTIAYFSDEGGEYTLHLAPSDGKGEVRRIELDGDGFYEDAKWSPSSKHISFTDNGWSLFLLDVESGETKRIAQEPLYGPIKTLHHAWSTDSRWIAYTLTNTMYFKTVYLYDLETGASQAITDALSDAAEPVFDKSGKHLFFSASTDAGPANTWFAMSGADIQQTNALYVAVLSNEDPSPFAARSDEEEFEDGEEEDEEEKEAEDSDAEETEGEEEEEALEVDPVRIDFEGLQHRIVALPVASAYYHGLEAGEDGQLYYLRSDDGNAFGPGGESALTMFDLSTREETELAPGATWFTLSADDTQVLVNANGGWSIAEAGSPVKDSRLDTDAIRVKIDPRAEWPQIFDEAWRINRDYFYDPEMHGADWEAMREKYASFLPHLSSRGDLNRVVRWMCSELGVGHHRVGGGDFLEQPDGVPGGLLGADYEVADGRYRFAKVFGGLNWNPTLRAPLSEPGIDVKAGEYLLAVDGEELHAPENLYSRFENTSGRIVELTVGPNADGSESRAVEVVPVGSETALRNRDWVEGNIEKVTAATDGRVAYVHVPNTAGLGHLYFKRYFFPQADRQAIIVDERYNGGGLFADYVIDLLRRPYVAHWAMRYGADLETPQGAIQGPKVMIIDENAGSGGDLLPWMFRKFELGTLVGRPTWGGLVGTLGFPTLMDGGSVSAPNLGIWTEDGFVVENVGVPPDVEVEQFPADVIAGRDPQLEKAIEIALEELERNPPPKHERPPFPIRVRR